MSEQEPTGVANRRDERCRPQISHTSKAAASPGSSSSPASETSSSPIRSIPAGARPTNSLRLVVADRRELGHLDRAVVQLVDHEQVEHADQPAGRRGRSVRRARDRRRSVGGERERDQIDRTERFGCFRRCHGRGPPGSLDVGRPFHLAGSHCASGDSPTRRDTVITLAVAWVEALLPGVRSTAFSSGVNNCHRATNGGSRMDNDYMSKPLPRPGSDGSLSPP